MTHLLFPDDSGVRTHHYVFWCDDENECLVPRPMYRDLRCDTCGKIDELLALRRGLPVELKIRSKRDFVGSGDDFLLVSRWARDFLTSIGLLGADFVSLPSDPNYFVLVPQVVETDLSTIGYRLIGEPCTGCGRYGEIVGIPPISSMQAPSEGAWLFSPALWSESIRGRRCLLYITDLVAQGIGRARLSGGVIIPAG